MVKVISIETEEFFCYTVFSRLGQVGVYDGRLNLLREYALQLSRCADDSMRTARRRRNIWINDAVYMPDAQFISVATSDGSIHFVDTVCLVHLPTFCITGTVVRNNSIGTLYLTYLLTIPIFITIPYTYLLTTIFFFW